MMETTANFRLGTDIRLTHIPVARTRDIGSRGPRVPTLPTIIAAPPPHAFPGHRLSARERGRKYKMCIQFGNGEERATPVVGLCLTCKGSRARTHDVFVQTAVPILWIGHQWGKHFIRILNITINIQYYNATVPCDVNRDNSSVIFGYDHIRERY